MATPLMNLDLPVVGPSGTLGPTYANMLNAALTLIDSHDHTTGKGPKVTPAGINVNANFNFNSFGQYNVNYLKLVDQSATVSDFVTVFAKDGDLYWKNDGGVDVQITLGNSLNAAAVGGIGGDYTTSTASVTYSDTTKTYTFKQSPTVTGDIAAGSLYVYENVVSGKYAKIKVPTGLAGNYDLTLPAALPASQSLVQMSSLGVISASPLAPRTLLENVNVVVGTTQISFITTSTTYVDVTNGSLTITTTGGPVRFTFIPSSTVNPARIGWFANASGVGQMACAITLLLLRDATTVGVSQYFTTGLYNVSGTPAYSSYTPASSFEWYDTPSAGTYIYKVQALVANAAGLTTPSANIANCKVMAMELK